MNDERLLTVLLAPHLSEKTSRLTDRSNVHAFRVSSDATKTEIKAAVEKLFKVKVDSVRITNKKPLPVRTRKGSGVRSGWKKAYVRLTEGQEIDFTSM